MKSGLTWRVCFSIFIFLLSTYLLLPDFLPKSLKENSAVQKFMPSTHISLGLDLQGGTHLTLGVDVEAALRGELTRLGEGVLSESTGKGLLLTSPQLLQHSIVCTLVQSKQKEQFEEMLKASFPQLEIIEQNTLDSNRVKYTLALKAVDKEAFTGGLIDQALNTIRSRIDEFGVAEPDVRKQEGDRIVIQLPGMADSERAVDIIGKTAHLEFRLVVTDPSQVKGPVEEVPFVSDKEGRGKVTLEKRVVLTGEHIERAVPGDTRDGFAVNISFDKRGAQIFSKVTEENVHRLLAIVLDGKVYSTPQIKQKLSSEASITGNFTFEEATDLALVLRAGSLPAPVTVLEERSVGPSLGQESISQGVTAAIVGSVLIMGFMAVYYSGAGIIANLMLLFDVLLILAGMAVFGATLTLPGLAGIVLTLGMAVDANVLIFERIREELHHKNAIEAIDAGFSRATLAIVDSNLTTIIAAVILYQLGTGPIRGFAVTLTLGILASMFTAIFVSRVIFDLWIRKADQKLSI